VLVEPNRCFDVILEAIWKCESLAEPWSGEVYRSAALRYAKTGDMVTGLGSAKAGGRWNPPGSFPTVYASLEPEAAMAECLAVFRYYGWALHDAMPRIFRALRADLGRVLDLRQPDAGRHLDAALELVRVEDWRAAQESGREATAQAIGRAAFEVGLEGLLVPSFASPQKSNLVAFPGRFTPGSSIRATK
jgi:RES domain-containing protein